MSDDKPTCADCRGKRMVLGDWLRYRPKRGVWICRHCMADEISYVAGE